MKEIRIKTIPHGEQRYPTSGDYFTDEHGVEQIRVSDLGNLKHEHLIAVHELIERVLCFHAGITNEMIDDFDLDPRAPPEPGDDPRAPYHNAHQLATVVERLLAAELGVNWNDYEKAVNAL